MTGLSELKGSWKIMAMSQPRTLRIVLSGRASRSSPSNRILASHTWPFLCSCSKRRMTLWANTDFPQPDSPSNTNNLAGIDM